MSLHLQRATIDDAPTLAMMNRHLIEAEGSRNPMSLPELEARMRAWLAIEWTALLILHQERAVGYILYQEQRDAYAPQQRVIHVRHFCIMPEYRGQGLGRAAFTQIVREWFPPDAAITLGVLETNPGGRRFWQRLGFAPYSTAMRRTPEGR